MLTGASRGIGVHMARALAGEGVNIALAARSSTELEVVRAEIETMGVRAIAVVCNVVKPEDRARLLERAETELGPIDVLINNAGIERTSRFQDAPESDFTDTLAINLEAPMLLTRAVVPGMLKRGSGHIVNIASAAGKVGVTYGSSYCASKHGLVGFSNALRGELKPQGVGVSVVCPAFITDAGMYDRWESAGVHAPRIAGSSKPTKVADVVISCIKRNRGEVLVNTPPIRPLVVLANIAPGIVPGLLNRLGYAKVFEKVIEKGL